MTKWEDIGGLQEAKNEIFNTILLPKLHPELFNEFIKPRTGILFYGPPGFLLTVMNFFF